MVTYCFNSKLSGPDIRDYCENTVVGFRSLGCKMFPNTSLVHFSGLERTKLPNFFPKAPEIVRD